MSLDTTTMSSPLRIIKLAYVCLKSRKRIFLYAGAFARRVEAVSQELSKLGLIDEYHLLTYPVVLGEGQRLFGERQKAELELISAEDIGSGVVAQNYRVKH
jgi:dihydrofolate reductase